MLKLTGVKVETIIIVTIIILLFVLLYLRTYKKSATADKENRELEIQELITDVKSELYKIEKDIESKKDSAAFELKSFELEINFIARKKSSTDAKISYEVITVGAGQEIGSEKVQKIKLVMQPIADKNNSSQPSGKVSDEPGTTIGEKPPKKNEND